MKFLPRFDFSRLCLWMSLLVVTLLVSVPLYASEPFIMEGEITSIDVANQIVEVDDAQYKIAQQFKIKTAPNETKQAMSIADLKVGQYIEFESIGNTIATLRVIAKRQQPE